MKTSPPNQALGAANTNAKRKQQLVMAGVVAVVAIVAVIGGTLMAPEKKAVAAAGNDKPTRIPIVTPGEGLSDKDNWRAQEAAKIAENNRTLNELQTKLAAMEKREADRKLEDARPKPVEAPKAVTSNTPAVTPASSNSAATPNAAVPNSGARGGYAMGVGIGQQIVNSPVPPAGAAARPPVGYPPGTPAMPVAPPGAPFPGQAVIPNGAMPTGAMQGPRIQRISASTGSEGHQDSSASPKAGPKPVEAGRADQANGGQRAAQAVARTAENYLPSGTFIEGRLLSGIDAPTGGQSQNNPMPLLIQLTSHAFLPSSMRSEVKGCFVIGTAYGDISSERANGRTESLSCVKEDGTAIDINIKGYIAGEDGKAGLRGRLVSKQGQILANALTAGLISGIGQALSFSSTTQTTGALGNVVTTPNPGQEAKAGFGTGFGKAMDKLAAYYIALADKVFPIIEVDADRRVTVVLTKGTFIDNQREPTSSISESFRGSTNGLVESLSRATRDVGQGMVRDTR